jgi:hypothetical protein
VADYEDWMHVVVSEHDHGQRSTPFMLGIAKPNFLLNDVQRLADSEQAFPID